MKEQSAHVAGKQTVHGARSQQRKIVPQTNIQTHPSLQPINAGEYHDLCDRLADLERRSGRAPLLCVTAADVPPAREYDAEGAAWVPDEMSEEGEEGEEAVGELGGSAVAGEPAAGVPEGGGAAGSPPQAAAAAGPEEATGPGSPGAGARGQPAAVSPPARQASGRGGWELL